MLNDNINVKKRDPFGTLPVETTCMILQYFKFREIVYVCYAPIKARFLG